MVTFLLVWLLLNAAALFVMGYRVDSEACYHEILDFIITDNVFHTMINFLITYLVLPLTLPKNIYLF